MRLGGPVYGAQETPQQWIEAVRRHGYSAAYCPNAVMKKPDDEKLIRAFEDAARAADIVIAEVGAWSNPISPDPAEAKKNIKLCQDRLSLADRIGARCCVNIAGSRGKKWDGPDKANLSKETFDIIAECVRTIIDAVKPTRTYYTLETMPWAWPDSADAYVALIKAIDRPRFAVHLDPTNLVNCPSRYYDNGAMIRECFEKLGPHIRSCHAKDIILHDRLMVHLDEVRIGTGGLDYIAFLQGLSKLDADIPLMLEHLASAEDYALAAEHVRDMAVKANVKLR